MKAGLLERIQAVGHWRLNIRPSVIVEPALVPGKAFQVVQLNSVRMRGWDYPCVVDRNDESFGRENHHRYVENWCDSSHHLEFWRMYGSAQFLHYKALWEDLIRNTKQPPGRNLSVTSAIYTVTEMIEFTGRLITAGLYESGCSVSIGLRNTARRNLWVSEPHRMGFSYPRTFHGEEFSLDINLAGEIDRQEVAAEVLVRFFAKFDWDVSMSKMEEEVHRYHAGDVR